jgi:hypothetical protein
MPKKKPAPSPPRKIPKRPTPPNTIPRVVTDATLADHLEIITRAIFQAGLSWAIIAARWPAFLAAFEQFDVKRVAAYGQDDLARLMSTDGLIHSEKKLVGTFANANTLLALERDYGTVENYLASFASYAELYADAHCRFAFMGDLSCYYWLLRTASTVPQFEDWIAGQKTDHPRMREMVLIARSEGASRERPDF